MEEGAGDGRARERRAERGSFAHGGGYPFQRWGVCDTGWCSSKCGPQASSVGPAEKLADTQTLRPHLRPVGSELAGDLVPLGKFSETALEQMQFSDCLVTIQKRAEVCPTGGGKQNTAWVVRSSELAVGIIPEPCPDPPALSVRLSRSARSQAHWPSPSGRLWITVMLLVGHCWEWVPVTTPCQGVGRTQRAAHTSLSEMHEKAFCGGCQVSWPSFQMGFGSFGLVLFFFRNLQMGNLAPFFIDMEPRKDVS